jgi:hypothetical protein
MGAEPQKSVAARPNSEESDARAEGDSPDSGYGNPDTETIAAEPATKPADAANGEADSRPAGRRSDRSVLVIAAAALAACAGLVLYGVLAPENKPKPRAVPSAEVTYEVTGSGTVDISYRAPGTSGNPDKSATATGVQLPWKKTVRVPLGKDPIVSITLGEKGSRARCALAIRGKHVQSSTASGRFGRATCSGPLPAPDGGEG